MEAHDSPMLDSHVDAMLNYLDHDGTHPVIDAVRVMAGEKPPLATTSRSMRIRNARREPSAPTLDRNGFELLQHTSAFSDFSDDARIRELYYPETEQLLARATGADKVVIFDHATRLDVPQPAKGAGAPPVRNVHCDQTFKSGPRRVREHLPADEAEIRLRGRCAIINVWRPIATPVYTAPLALCDARSIAPDDIVPASFVYPDKIGEVALFRPNPDHQWFYFPRLTPDEAILIKIYDSLTDGTARLSAHTAFEDPSVPENAPPRRSIEVRALVFWAS
jgi:hypothetical protein